MRELAEMTSQSQKEAFDVVRKRIEENVEGIRNESPAGAEDSLVANYSRRPNQSLSCGQGGRGR